MSYKIIREKIIEKINAEKVKINQAYATSESTIENFPAVTISPTGSTSEQFTTKGREVVYNFNLTGYYPFKNDAEQVIADNAMDEVADELITMFNKSSALTVAGVAQVRPVSIDWAYQQSDEGIYRIVELKLECRVVGAC